MQQFLWWTHREHTSNIACNAWCNRVTVLVHPCTSPSFYFRNVEQNNFCGGHMLDIPTLDAMMGATELQHVSTLVLFSIILLQECCVQQFLWWTHGEHTINIALNTGRNRIATCVHPCTIPSFFFSNVVCNSFCGGHMVNTPSTLHATLGATELQHVSTFVLFHHSTSGMLHATVSVVGTW